MAASDLDANNRLLQWGAQTLGYDANGNLTHDGVNSYTWNARDQLIAISGPVPASFSYDGLGRRRSKTINGITTRYLYDGQNPIQEQSPTGVRANLLAGLGLDQPV